MKTPIKKKQFLSVCIGSMLLWGATASVAADLTSIAVTPANNIIAPGETKQYTATGTFSDSTTQVLTGMFSPAASAVASREYGFDGASTATTFTTLDGKVKVLIAGGGNTTTELYDVATNTFSATGSMIAPRSYATATLLNNGKILIAGGRDSVAAITLTSAELYDPATGKFTLTGSMSENRFVHSATRLQNGKVLMVAGWSNKVVDGVQTTPQDAQTNEIYDPVTGEFSIAGALAPTRYAHTATLLGNGKVLVAGGNAARTVGALNNADLYTPDPTGTGPGTFNPAPPMTVAMAYRTATLLDNGKVLIAGGDLGTNDSGTELAELYDPSTNTFIATSGAMTVPRHGQTSTRLANGQVLITGGRQITTELATAEIYDPVLNEFRPTSSMAVPRAHHTAADLENGSVLIAGGKSSATSTELYTLGSKWSSSNPSIATINSAGLASSGTSPGTISITATSGSISGSTSLLNYGADLTVTAVSSNVASVKRGQTFTFTATTKNLGNQATPIETRTGLYLFNGTVNKLLGYVSIPSGLAPGISTTLSKVVTVPTTQATGIYQLRAIANYTGVLVELDETAASNTFTGANINITK